MRILYYECFSGISGDMNLGAMIDAGVDSKYLLRELSKLNIDDEFKIEINKVIRKGITGTKVDVIIKHSHHHRNLKDIENIICSSGINNKVKKLSLKIFMKVAEAEAKVHGKGIDEVHFHEVGALDSIIDIVGAAICLEYLKIDKIMSSTVEVGSGFVKCDHGILPVPAPATVEILKNIPIKSGSIPFEATTPTGAAILAAVVNEFTDNKNLNITKIAYGIGTKDEGNIPNVLRVYICEEENKLQGDSDFEKENAVMLECNIDDMNPEFYSYIINKLLENGAEDAFITPIIMKKGRPAVMLCVLTKQETIQALENIIFIETTTLGIRKYNVSKEMLSRKEEKITMSLGEVSVKRAFLNGSQIKCKAEYEDCVKIAIQKGLPLQKVYSEVNKVLNK